MGVKLWAPEHPEGCHIGLTNATTFMVPHDPEGIDVPPEFRREALARGCIPVGMTKEEPAGEAFDRAVLIRTRMEEMYRADEQDYFTNDGKPNLTKLNALVGFNVERSERDRLWAEVQVAMEGRDE